MQQQLDALREQLTETQRLATIGTIAAVVAHEFNNLLTPVVSYSHFALTSLDAPSQAGGDAGHGTGPQGADQGVPGVDQGRPGLLVPARPGSRRGGVRRGRPSTAGRGDAVRLGP